MCCLLLVAEEGAGLTLLHIAVLVDDLVQSVLHPVCKAHAMDRCTSLHGPPFPAR
ncbi:RIKEN cDNA 5630401J11, isoform CRA_b [Mus musculus]|nr:RIKEN cDNA 5630401J11, isoform CRA_b [Mus musculus]